MFRWPRRSYFLLFKIMTYTCASGIIFLYVIVSIKVFTHGTADICKRQDGKVCSFPLLCGVGLISVTEVKTHYDICPSNTRCDYCCQKDVKLNNNATTSMQKECDNKSQCDPAVVFNLPGVGQAEVSFTCSVQASTIEMMQTTGSLSASTTPLTEFIATVKRTQLSTNDPAVNNPTSSTSLSISNTPETTLDAEGAQSSVPPPDDADKFPWAAVLVPTLLVLITLVIALVVIGVRRHTQKSSGGRNVNDLIASFDRSGGHIQVVSNIYGDNTTPPSRNTHTTMQGATEDNAIDEVYNTTNDIPIRHQLDVYDHLTSPGLNYATAFVEDENEQNYDSTQDGRLVNDPTYGITIGHNRKTNDAVMSVNADGVYADTANISAEYAVVKRVSKGNGLLTKEN